MDYFQTCARTHIIDKAETHIDRLCADIKINIKTEGTCSCGIYVYIIICNDRVDPIHEMDKT